jgi:hypothetical protein
MASTSSFHNMLKFKPSTDDFLMPRLFNVTIDTAMLNFELAVILYNDSGGEAMPDDNDHPVIVTDVADTLVFRIADFPHRLTPPCIKAVSI